MTMAKPEKAVERKKAIRKPIEAEAI